MKSMLKRTAAVCMVLVMLCTVFPAALAAGDTDEKAYTGQVLAAINTDRGDTFAHFQTDQQQEESEEGADVGPAADGMPGSTDCLIDLPQPLSANLALEKEAKLPKSQTQAVTQYRIGDRKTIRYLGEMTGNDLLEKAELVCTAIGDRCTIWREEGTYPRNYSDTYLAARFDAKIPKLHELYGDARIDTDGDGKIAVFIYAIKKDNGGYFSAMDLIDKFGRIGNVWFPTIPDPSACDCIHIQSYWDWDGVIDTCVHEYQHYIFFSHFFAGKNNFTFNYRAFLRNETYIMESFSTSAELLINGSEDYAYNFASYSLPSRGVSYFNWAGAEYGQYTCVFMLGQYFRTRYAALTGDLDGKIPGKAFYKDFMENLLSLKKGDVWTLIANMLYPQDKYPQLKNDAQRCDRLLVDFWLAVFCKEPEGDHGFNGEAWVENIDSYEMICGSLSSKPEEPIRSGMAAFYIIGSGEKSSTVHITQSSGSLTFAAIETVGYMLQLDANGGWFEYENYPQLLRTTYSIHSWNLPLRSGYTFEGWAETPDAQAAQYVPGDKVTLTEDTTLYAVWKPAREVVVGQEYTISDRAKSGENFRFIPDADGLYKVEIRSENEWCSCSVLLDDGKQIEPVSETDTAEIQSFYFELNAGTAYDLNISRGESDVSPPPSFTVTHRTSYHTLTMHSNGPDPEICKFVGETSYTLSDVWFWRFACVLLGWAESPDAVEPEYAYGDTVTLTQDMTLYAIWREPTELRPDGRELTVQDANGNAVFCFTPETSGTYQLQRSASFPDDGFDYHYSELEVIANNVRIALTQQTSFSLVMQAGQPYFFFINAASAEQIGASIRKTSDKSTAVLTLSPGKNAAFTVRLHGKGVYEIPEYTPVSRDGMKFRCWTDPSTDFWYYPGDTITLIGDQTLQAVWIEPQDASTVLVYRVTWVFRLLQNFGQYLRVCFADLQNR